MNLLSKYPKEINVFLGASLINSTGSALMWPLIAMFVFDELGRSMAAAGLVILVHSLGGISGQLLGGALYHRVGVKRLIVGALGMNALGLFILPAVSQSWPLFMAMMALIGMFNALSMPAIQAFIGFRFPERRGELFNVIYVANNIGVAVGTALSGFLADVSYTLSFVLNGVTSGAFAVFFLLYLGQVENERGSATSLAKQTGAEKSGTWILIRNIRIYLFMSIAVLLLNIGNSIWNTGVSPYIIAEDLPKRMYGFLWTLNGILIFVAQPLMNVVKRYAARTITAQMTASGIFYMAGYACILTFHNYPGMVLGMVLATFGEMLISPAMPAFLSEHAGKETPFYLGLAGGIGSAGRVIGPYMMGSMYDGGGLMPVAWLAVVAALVSVGFFALHGIAAVRRLDGKRQLHSPAYPE